MDVDYIRKYKDQKAYSYWMSGFVNTVYFAKCPADSKIIFLKSDVCPSQRLLYMTILTKFGYVLKLKRKTLTAEW